MRITWNTQVDAPGCVGEIVAEDGRSVLIQTDWDWPGVASTFGWAPRKVQGGVIACAHPHTDGTVDCPGCGMTTAQFLASAREWLEEHDGAEAEDPGYFVG